MLAELMAGSMDASPALQQTDRQQLIREAMRRHDQAARPQHALRRPRRGARQSLPARRRRRHRHHRRTHRRQEDHDPRRPGRLAGGQGRVPGPATRSWPSTANRWSTGRSSDVVAPFARPVGTPVVVTVLRPAPPAELTLRHEARPHHPDHRHLRAPRRCRADPPDRLQQRHDGQSEGRHRQGAGRDRHATSPGSSSTCAAIAAACSIRRRPCRRAVHRQRHDLLHQGRHPDSRRTYKSSNGASRRPADRGADERRFGLGGRDRRRRPAGPRPRGRGRHDELWQGHGADRRAPGQRRRADPHLVPPAGASGYTWNELGVLPSICTSKVNDIGHLGPHSVDSSQATLMRWHALRNPTHEEVTDLRKICPPGEFQPGARCRDRHPPAARSRPLCPCRAGRHPAGVAPLVGPDPACGA